MSNQFLVASDISPLVQDHSLLFSRKHIRKFGNLSLKAARSAIGLLREISKNPPFLGRQVLYFEHGPITDGLIGSGCCDHAHVHILPLSKDRLLLDRFEAFQEKLTSVLNAHVLRAELSPLGILALDQIPSIAHHNYIWLGMDLDKLKVFELHVNERQFLRKLVAEILGETSYQSWDAYDLKSARTTTSKIAENLGVDKRDIQCHSS